MGLLDLVRLSEAGVRRRKLPAVVTFIRDILSDPDVQPNHGW
jgi:hypothetical protein